MRKFLLYIMGVISMLSFQSCLHDDKELFDESAAERLEHATEETKQILESSTSGWAFQYYLGDEYTSGGCTYLVKFKDGKADVALDLADDPTDITHSSYDVVKDQGPVLTFNTYNEWMHYFANPNSDGTTSGGDFEFSVMKISNDTIDLKGRTTGNKMRLIRLPENTDWKTYLEDISGIESEMFTSYQLTEDGNVEGILTFDADTRRVSFVDKENNTSTYPYCVTPTGIVLPDSWKSDAHTFVLPDGKYSMVASDVAAGKMVSLDPYLTPDYVFKKIGTSIKMNDAAQSVTEKVKMANTFTYSTDADWLTITADDASVTFSAAANNEGHPRVATVKVKNENGEDEMTVCQMEYAKDISGTYVLQYYDVDGTVQQNVFDVTADNADAIDMPIKVGKYTLHASLKWNAETNSFDWNSFQYMGKYGSYYAYDILYTDSYWSAVSDKYTYSAPVAYDDENGTYAIFSEGSILGEDINMVYVMACAANPPASTSDFKGYLEIMQGIALVKLPDGASAASFTAKARGSQQVKVHFTKMPAFHASPVFGKKLIK